MLKLEGFEVRTAIDPETGLRIAGEARPKAIILDLRMPLLDGVSFLRQLRTLEGHRTTPVAIVTGDQMLEDDVSSEIRALGAKLKHKPLWLEDLIGLARELLRVSS